MIQKKRYAHSGNGSIKPIIDIRKMWKDGESTKILRTKNVKNVTYDYLDSKNCTKSSLYDKRTSVERVNSRIEVSFGFERHYIRGLKQEKPELMRSLVKVA